MCFATPPIIGHILSSPVWGLESNSTHHLAVGLPVPVGQDSLNLLLYPTWQIIQCSRGAAETILCARISRGIYYTVPVPLQLQSIEKVVVLGILLVIF